MSMWSSFRCKPAEDEAEADKRWTSSPRAGRVGGMSIRIQCLCVDTTDPARLAAFWAEALGWRQTHAEDDEVVLEPPAGSPEDGVAPELLFLRVPERKQGKNRLHI